jgi:hypothetical protein
MQDLIQLNAEIIKKNSLVTIDDHGLFTGNSFYQGIRSPLYFPVPDRECRVNVIQAILCWWLYYR